MTIRPEETISRSGLKQVSIVQGQLFSCAALRMSLARRPLFEIGRSSNQLADVVLRSASNSPLRRIADFVSFTERYDPCTLERSRMQPSWHNKRTPPLSAASTVISRLKPSIITSAASNSVILISEAARRALL